MPQLTALNLLLLILVFVMNLKAHAETVMDVQEGEASYYADALHGNKTASGVPYDKDAMTAAHRSLPFGTKVKVTYLKTGKSVQVVINDRGPYVKGRIIDLSRAAARVLGLIGDGHGRVRLEGCAP
ncbi:MAG: septal ring lytic transglycosylase RlpA family protein [Thiogranum sp.]